MTYAFIDRQCPACSGYGCDACDWYGLVGSTVLLSTLNTPEPSPWADSVRHFRERSGLSICAMGEKFGLNPVQWSELERGKKQPTDEQRASIDKLMHN